MALLDWDLQTKMPRGASTARARHLETMTRLTHELFIDNETGRLLSAVETDLNSADYNSNDASLVRVARRDYDKAKKLPTDLVAELARVTALAHGIWAKARQENDFNAFAPILEEILVLKRQVAEHHG